MTSNHLILYCPLLLLSATFPSIRVFWNEWTLRIRWPKHWSFSFNISLPMNTQDWSPLGWTGWISLQSKGLSRVLQHHSSKASILLCSAFFIVQLLHPYAYWKNHLALTRSTFFGKVMSLLLNMLSAAAAAKLLQSSPTLWDPMDYSLPGSSIHGIFQARVLEWGAIAFSDTLSRLVIAFLPRSKHLLTSWLQSPSAVSRQK